MAAEPRFGDWRMALGTGDPEAGPASFSRFVLPFAYRLESISEGSAASAGAVARYRSVLPSARSDRIDDATWERLHYLTADTARALYQRTRWLELKRPHSGPSPAEPSSRRWSSFRFPREDDPAAESFEVAMAPPRLVLFDFDRNQGRRRFGECATGFLIIELYFPDGQPAPRLDDLLRLNELFRYWCEPFPEHDEKQGLRSFLGDLTVGGARLSDRQDEDAAGDRNGRRVAVADAYLGRWDQWLRHPVELEPGGLQRLMPVEWPEQARRWREDPLSGEGGWVVYADCRCYVWTCALLPDGWKTLEKAVGRDRGVPWGHGHWVKLLNVDSPGDRPEDTARTTGFERCWAEERTYRRWIEAGSVYGFTYHSGAAIVPPIDGLPLWQHFRDLYFDQALLLLYLRVTSFRFSYRLTEICVKAGAGGERAGEEAWHREFSELRREFALFTNLYRFPLVSNRQQGVEMYAVARRAMDVDELFSEVQEEIHATDEYFALAEQREQTRAARRLSNVATVGLWLALVTSVFGMNVVVNRVPGPGDRIELVLVDIAWLLLVAFLVHRLFLATWRDGKLFHRLFPERERRKSKADRSRRAGAR